MAPAGGKGKKKWSKGKVKDKAQHAVLLDKTTSDKLYKDVQSYRLVTIATLVDRLKINGSLARQCLADLEEKGQIKPVVTHSKMKIYSMLQSMYSKIAARLWAEGCILGGETMAVRLTQLTLNSPGRWRCRISTSIFTTFHDCLLFVRGNSRREGLHSSPCSGQTTDTDGLWLHIFRSWSFGTWCIIRQGGFYLPTRPPYRRLHCLEDCMARNGHDALVKNETKHSESLACFCSIVKWELKSSCQWRKYASI